MAARISVLMANLNNGRFIGRAVSSILDQTLADWELIIVDDGSVDDSPAIIREIAARDGRIRAILRDETRGVGYTKREAAQNATSPVLTMLDPDDALHPSALARHVDAHAAHGDVALTWSDYYVCDPDLTVTGESQSGFRGDGEGGYLVEKPGSIHSLWSCKTSSYRQTPGFSADYRLAEDQDLFYKLEEVGRTLFVPGTLYYYRHHPMGMSTGNRTAEAFGWHLLAMNDALRRRTRRPKSRRMRELATVRAHWRSFAQWGLSTISDGLLKRLARELLSESLGARLAWSYSREVLRRRFRPTAQLTVNDPMTPGK